MPPFMMQGYKGKALIMADEMRASSPTIRQRGSSGLQEGMENIGIRRQNARRAAQTIMGGDSSALPIGLGVADFVPFLGTTMGLEEGAEAAGEAYDSAKRGDYIDAAGGVAGAAAGLIPGGYSTYKAGKNMLKKLKTIDLPKLKLIETDSVPKKSQSLREWAMAGGGVPESHKDRADVWHKKAHNYAKGGAVNMAEGGNPKDKSFGEKLFKKFEHLPKVKPPYPPSLLDVAYGLYKYKTGTFPVENALSNLEYYTKPRSIDTGSVPVGTQFNSTDFDSNELDKKLEPIQRRAKGGEVRMAKGGKVKDIVKSALTSAAEAAGMKAPVTANKDLTTLQDFHTSLGDQVREGAVNMQKLVESMPYKYDKGQRVFTEDSAKRNKPPYTVLHRVPYGNQPMRGDHPDLAPGNKIGNTIKDPITGKTQRTPYEPGYRVRYEDGDKWSQFDIPESAIRGDVEMAKGGKVKNIVKEGLEKLFGKADKAPKGVEPIVVRTPEEREVIDKFGQKQEQEAARQKKVEKAAKESASQSPEAQAAKPAKSKGPRVKSEADTYRKMAETQGDEAVLKAARAGEHLKPTKGGYVGAPRTVTSGQGLGAMRKNMDTDFADSVKAVRLADPERLGTWYDRAKQGIAESTEPYQLPRTLEQHGVFSAGVSPESELAFSLKHLNSRNAGDPQMAYRGAGMRNLDNAVAENRPANMGFKIGEYANKNDPRLPNTGLFGVNDFRRAQGMGYTDAAGNPWHEGVRDTMHPFMDAETALQVSRSNEKGIGGRTDWQGPHIQEVPWVYGKAQDLHSRGLKGRYAGDELEGIKSSIQDANNTARDYMYKHAGSATHEAIPGASTGHVPSMLDAPFEEKVAYGNVGRWDVPAPEYALSDMGTVGAGNRDAIYSALGYRQLPTIEASGAYFPEGSKVAEHQPVKMARPLLDFPTGGGGLVAEPTRQTMNFAERFRALGDANEAFGFNLPNTMADVKGKNSLMLDTRGANPRYLDEPHTGVMPNEAQMGALTQALGDVGYGVAPTSRGATVFPFDSKATAADARRLMKDKGSALQQIYPSEMEPSLNTSGYGPGVGMYTPEGFKATEPFSGQATMGLLKEASYLPPEVAINLGESEDVRKALKGKIKRDAALPNARADIQETRRFFSEADWPKAVALIRQGYTPAAALAALGYSASSMAEDRR